MTIKPTQVDTNSALSGVTMSLTPRNIEVAIMNKKKPGIVSSMMRE